MRASFPPDLRHPGRRPRRLVFVLLPPQPPRRRSSSSSSHRSRTPATDPQRRLPIPRRRSGDDEDLNRGITTRAAVPKAETATQGPDGMWYLRPKPKRYPLEPPRKDAYSADSKSEAPGPRPKGSVREQLNQCSTRPHVASSDSKSPKQHTSDAPLVCSSGAVSSEGSVSASPPGALIDAFLKTTDAAAQRAYTVCSASVPLGSHFSYVTRLAPRTHRAPRLSPRHPRLHVASPPAFSLTQLPAAPVCALQVGSSFGSSAIFRASPTYVANLLAPVGPSAYCLPLGQQDPSRIVSPPDRHVAQLVHPLCHYAHCCSRCQFPSRVCLFRLGFNSGPLLPPCHLRVTRPLRRTVIIMMRPPPSWTRTRSWRPSTRQPAWPCYTIWPTDRPELHVVRCSVRQYRCHCMALSRERPELPELALRRHLFVVGAGPRESLINPIIHQIPTLRPPRALRQMPTTLWRSEWTPPGQSTSASRSASFQPRPRSLSATQAALSLPIDLQPTATFAQRSRLKTIAIQQRLKSLSIAVSAQPQPSSPFSLPPPLYTPCVLPICPWLRLFLMCPCGSCMWVRPSAERWSKAFVQLLQACMHNTGRRTSALSFFLLPQALYLEALPPSLQLSSQPASWRTPQETCQWTASRSAHRLIRLVPHPHLHLPITNWNKRLRKLNIEHWRSCLVPPRSLRLRNATSQLPPPVRLREAGRSHYAEFC